MSLKRIWTLIQTEALHGPKDVILVMAILIPVLLALFVSLAFGDIFSSRARLGYYTEGNLNFTSVLSASGSMSVTAYSSEGDLKDAVAGGSIDVGILLPVSFEDQLAAKTVNLKAYIWGESLAKNRTIITLTIGEAIREIAGSRLPVNINSVPLGDSSLPWSDRLLPLTVVVAIFFGGMMVPAASLIQERQRKTLEALNVTPVSMADIFTAKGLSGIALALIMGVITLAITSSFGNHPLALVGILALGALLASEIGLLVGTFVRDINTLFSFWKFGGILLFGPAFIFMFPQIPSWIGFIFPTYYLIRPVTDMAVLGAGFSSVILYVGILVIIVLTIGFTVLSIAKRLSSHALKVS